MVLVLVLIWVRAFNLIAELTLRDPGPRPGIKKKRPSNIPPWRGSQEWPAVGAAVQEDARAGSSLEMHLLKIGND